MKHNNHWEKPFVWWSGRTFSGAFSKRCGGASIFIIWEQIHCLVSSAPRCLSWMFREQLLPLAAVELPCWSNVTTLLECCSWNVGVFSKVSRVIRGNFVEVLVGACRFSSRYFVFRDLLNSTTLSRHFENFEPFYAKILNFHGAPRCADLVSRLRSCISIGLFTRNTSSISLRLLKRQSRFRMDFNFSEQWSEILWRHSF